MVKLETPPLNARVAHYLFQTCPAFAQVLLRPSLGLAPGPCVSSTFTPKLPKKVDDLDQFHQALFFLNATHRRQLDALVEKRDNVMKEVIDSYDKYLDIIGKDTPTKHIIEKLEGQLDLFEHRIEVITDEMSRKIEAITRERNEYKQKYDKANKEIQHLTKKK